MRSLVLALASLVPLLTICNARADAPRIAVVLEGDPTPGATAAAEGLETALLASEEVAQPSDPLVRAALRGNTGAPDDGLDAVRGLRRRIGWSQDADREALASLAGRLALAAVVVVHVGDAPVARVYDVTARRYFAGEAAIDEAGRDATVAFIVSRAAAAERRRTAPTPADVAATPETAGAPDGDTAASASPAPLGATTEPTVPPVDAPPQRSWIRRNWPFLVAGALLAGTATFFIVQRGGHETSPPVIHVRPGGTP